jgi:hypothetical protein
LYINYLLNVCLGYSSVTTVWLLSVILAPMASARCRLGSSLSADASPSA